MFRRIHFKVCFIECNHLFQFNAGFTNRVIAPLVREFGRMVLRFLRVYFVGWARCDATAWPSSAYNDIVTTSGTHKIT